MEKNPFSLYDFLGYVFPGAITLEIISFVVYLHNHSLLLSLNSINLYINNLLSSFNWDDSILFIVSAYVLGHIVAYASSLTIEPYSVWRFGYPSKFMLRGKPEKDYFSVKHGTNNSKKWCIYIFKGLVAIIILPVFLLDNLLGSRCNLNIYYVKELDDKIVKDIVRKVSILYKKIGLKGFSTNSEISQGDIDFHRVVYHYVYEKHEAHRSKMDNYVALYGFMRAIDFIMVIVFWISLIVLIKEFNNIYLDFWLSILWLFGVTIFCLFFFMGFMKFYRRFTLESLMCLVVDADIKQK